MAAPAQKQLVDQLLKCPSNLARLNRRLLAFPNINSILTSAQDDFRSSNQTAPYYCSALAFRLAIYHREDIFLRLEGLLSLAKCLPNYDVELQNITNNLRRYEYFYSLIWMLQVVEFFFERGAVVKFNPDPKGGPDISVSVSSTQSSFWVECYFYHKFWRVYHFIEDLLPATGRDDLELRPRHWLYRPSMKEEQHDLCLNTLLTPILGNESAVTVHWPNCRAPELSIVKNGSIDEHNAHGCSDIAWRVFLQESVNNKKDSNKLSSHRPNLVAINGLGVDWGGAAEFRRSKTLPHCVLPESICGAWWNHCGLNERLELCRDWYKFREIDHPFVVAFGGI